MIVMTSPYKKKKKKKPTIKADNVAT